MIVRAINDEQVKGLNISKSKTEIFVYGFGGSNWEVDEAFSIYWLIKF